MASAQLAFNKMSPVSSTRDQTASKPGLATCFLLQQTLLTAGRYRAFREEQSNQSTFRTKPPVQLSSEICLLGQLPKGLHQLCFVLALGTSKVGNMLRREICLPRRIVESERHESLGGEEGLLSLEGVWGSPLDGRKKLDLQFLQQLFLCMS